MRHLLIKSFVAVIFALLISTASLAKVPRVVSYQGQLTDSAGVALDTTIEMTFTIYDESIIQIAIWAETQTVTVVNGLFSVLLGIDSTLYYSVFADSARSLGISVGIPGEEPEISPRTKFSSVAFSYNSLTADSAGYADSSGYTDSAAYAADAGHALSISDNSVNSAKIQDSSIQFSDIGQNGAASGEVIEWNGSQWVAGVDDIGGGGGWTDDGNVVRLETSTDSVGIGTSSPSEKLEVSGNFKATGTIQSGSSIIINGTTDQITASSGTIDFDNENLVTTGKVTIGPGHTNSGIDAFVAGESNSVSGDYSNISGGSSNTASGLNSGIASGNLNVAEGTGSFVGGGRYNKARGDYSVVAGGGTFSATDSNLALGNYSSIGGGARHRTLSPYSTIGGGFGNTTSHVRTTVGGGEFNTASGSAATIGGGRVNLASGTNSVVGGGTVIAPPRVFQPLAEAGLTTPTG